ncbi:MAG: hypothetical protein LIQ31_01265 [Planctomycetes bacterium]|nr:hypothetical protein [Planctomycetota bacterium]
MADSPFNMGKYNRPSSPRPGRENPAPPPRKLVAKAPGMQISCRATNPLSLQDDLEKVFLDENQAKATTATRLFRNDELFAATKKVTSEFLGSARGGLFSMWSTGCSSGEEVYSMAMIALGEFDKFKKPPNMEAFGTDINRNRIMEAREGVYLRPSKDAMASNYWVLLNKYADIAQSEVSMGPVLRKVCKFTLFDMRNKPKKHTFHFIVCNHVLQYYDAPGPRHIIGNLIAVLKPGGYLYLEGVTDHGLDGLPLEKVVGSHNMFKVAETRRSLTRRFFRKT